MLQEASTQRFDFEAMESAHVQRYAQLQGQYDECRCHCCALTWSLPLLTRHATRLAHELREGDYIRMQVALDETLERLVAVRTPSPFPITPSSAHAPARLLDACISIAAVFSIS
jgi:hypothetical protein